MPSSYTYSYTYSTSDSSYTDSTSNSPFIQKLWDLIQEKKKDDARSYFYQGQAIVPLEKNRTQELDNLWSARPPF